MKKEQQKRQSQPVLEQKEDNELHEPKMYRCVIVNDNVTPMDFVVEILKTVFAKKEDEAVAIMLKTHNEGRCVCGIYVKEIADTKQLQTESAAQSKNYPLKIEVEEE